MGWNEANEGTLCSDMFQTKPCEGQLAGSEKSALEMEVVVLLKLRTKAEYFVDTHLELFSLGFIWTFDGGRVCVW